MVGVYHAGMPDDKRAEVHNAFLRDRLKVVVATTAFGMGIDKVSPFSLSSWRSPFAFPSKTRARLRPSLLLLNGS